MAEISTLPPKHATDTERSSDAGMSSGAPQVSDEKLGSGLKPEAKTRSKLRILAVLSALFVRLELALFEIPLNSQPER